MLDYLELDFEQSLAGKLLKEAEHQGAWSLNVFVLQHW